MNVEELSERKARLETAGRISEIERVLADLGQARAEPEAKAEGLFRALSMLLVDAILDGDEASLERARGLLQRGYVGLRRDATEPDQFERRGQLLALIGVTHWGLERVLPLRILAEFEGSSDIEVGSHAHKFLQTLASQSGLTNRQLAVALDTGETEVSRVGQRLETAGAARKRRLGRANHWDLTPKGVAILGILNNNGVPRPRREHRQFQT